MKTLAGHNPRDLWECDSVPQGRQDVATGESPWYTFAESPEVPKGRQELRPGCLMSSFQD